MSEVRQTDLFDRRVLCGSRASLTALARQSQGGRTGFFCNVHMLMLSQDDPRLAAAMADADLVFPDGVPLAWLQRRLGFGEAEVLRGYEAMQSICDEAAGRGKVIGLFGSSGRVLEQLVATLSETYPGLQIGFAEAPPHLEGDEAPDMGLVARLNARKLDYLFVGLGCPKQELWIHRHRPYLSCTVFGVGAAFDWLAGTTRKPPGWMEKRGLAWLYRFAQNPARMWYRYLIYNTKFILFSSRFWIRQVLNAGSRERPD